MHVIYSRARTVYAWLGLNNSVPDVETGLRALAHPDESTPESSLYLQTAPIVSIPVVLSQPYWTRCWIIQELCRAKSPILLSESGFGVDFLVFLDNLSKTFKESGTQWMHPSQFEIFQTLQAFHRQESVKSRRPQMSLMEALLKTRYCHAAQHRDRIYSLLSLSHDGHKLVDSPNYIQSENQVYWELAHNMIHKQGHIAVILLARGRPDRVTKARESISRTTRRSLAPSSAPSVDQARRPNRVMHAHNVSQSLNVEDMASISRSHTLKTLPTWVPSWPELGSSVTPWIERAVLTDENNTTNVAAFDDTTLCLEGWELDIISSVSGINGVIQHGKPVPEGSRGDARRNSAGADSSPMALRRASTALPHLRAVDVLRRVWAALLAPYCSVTKQAPANFNHSCKHPDCVGVLVPGYVFARLLWRSEAQEVSQWYQTNRGFTIGDRTLSDYVNEIHLESVRAFEDQTKSKFWSNDRNLEQHFCGISNTESFPAAIALLRDSHLRLAATQGTRVLPVYREAKVHDTIYRLKGCGLPVVLRSKTEDIESPTSRDPGSNKQAIGVGRSDVVPAPVHSDDVHHQVTTGALLSPAPTSRPRRGSGTSMPGDDDAIEDARQLQGMIPDSGKAIAPEFEFIGEAFIYTRKGLDHALRTILSGWKDKHLSEDAILNLRIV